MIKLFKKLVCYFAGHRYLYSLIITSPLHRVALKMCTRCMDKKRFAVHRKRDTVIISSSKATH